MAGLVAAAIALLLTPAPVPLPQMSRPSGPTVAGAFHVHTDRSPDAALSIDAAAAAAGRAGLQFVVATEHGDGTRAPLPPAYHAGILWIDGVEVSTTDGHYATFGMGQSPYPLAGDARDVAEDVARLGGTGVAAHGDSQKSEAQWKDWDAPIDGLEWLNLDSVWREAGALRLARTAITYFFRPSAALASLASRPDTTLAHLDALAERRRIITLAASDAHGRTIPSDEACFGAFSTRVELDAPLTGNADADGRSVIAALRAGHHYTSIDAVERPAAFEFTAHEGGLTAREGDRLPGGNSVAFDIHVDGPSDVNTVLLRNGEAVEESHAKTWRHETDGRTAEYRVEVTVPASPGHPPLPWIVSNPIFVGLPDGREQPAATPTFTVLPTPLLTWRVEKDASSLANLAAAESGMTLHYALGAGAATNQFVAAVAPPPANSQSANGIGFTVRASHPVRFSVELRSRGDVRWQRSVYADATPRHVDIPFDDMRLVQPNAAARPDLASADALMFVVGVSNTTPGTSGDILLTGVALLKF